MTKRLFQNKLKSMKLLADKKLWLKALSGVCVNLSAAWFAAVLISPGFLPLDILALTRSFLFGTLFLLFSVKFEGSSK